MVTVTRTVIIQMDPTTVPVAVDGDWILMDTLAMVSNYNTTLFVSIFLCNVDTNECSEGTSGCTQICNNTLGSYFCICYIGYSLQNDNHTCIG